MTIDDTVHAAKKFRIYIAGPYTKGDTEANVRSAIEAADAIMDSGHWPYVPHLAHFWHQQCPRDFEDWLSLDFHWLGLCSALVRLPGESSGADREVRFAQANNIPVFFGLESFLKSARNGIHDRRSND